MSKKSPSKTGTKTSKKENDAILTTGTGCPIGDKNNSLTVGARGPQLLQDNVYIDEMSRFVRERIPERVVHAKGAGAFGYFECTNDITKYCKAAPFSKIGQKTEVAVRLSTVAGESGSADTVRDVRGFAVKFYTNEGNFDLTALSTPIFFIRDAMLLPSLFHSQKRNPKTHLKDPNAFWDFNTLVPETVHNVTMVFTDRGIPDGYRHMNAWACNTYKLVNKDGVAVYCKFHLITQQGIKNLTEKEAMDLTATDPDYATRDLYDAISKGDYPQWKLSIQVMTFEQAESYRFNPFDATKIWPHKEFPLIPVGKLVLNANPDNYFVNVEEIGFSPANLIPGIEPSPDKLLQGRLFAYGETQRHRLGSNFLQIPINVPKNTKVSNYERDGPMCVDNNQGGAVNYFPNSFGGPNDNAKYLEPKFSTTGDVQRYNSEDDDNYSQTTALWKILKPDERTRLIQNIASNVKEADKSIQDRVVAMFSKVSVELGNGIKSSLK